MMATLRLYVEDGWPERQRACEWALLDAGRVLHRGRAAPEHWPAADVTEGMLDPALLGCYRVRLPARARQERERLAVYALEDQLLEDPERYHVAVGADADSGTPVLTIARGRLAALVDALAALGRPPDRLVAAAELLPRRAAEWLLWQSPAGSLNLQAGGDGACPLDSIADIPPLLAGAKPPPDRLCVLARDTVAGALAAAKLPVPVVDGGSFDWADADWQRATNLLAGAFAPRRRWGQWRQALRWGLVALGLYAALVLGEWATLAWRQAALARELRQIAQTALPGQPIVAPLAQLVAAADEQRHRRGEAGLGDFLALTLRAADLTTAGEVEALDYEPGRLTMQIRRLDGERERTIRAALAMAGLDLRVARQANAVRLSIGTAAGGEAP
jgi:general secretion pathway protein L